MANNHLEPLGSSVHRGVSSRVQKLSSSSGHTIPFDWSSRQNRVSDHISIGKHSFVKESHRTGTIRARILQPNICHPKERRQGLEANLQPKVPESDYSFQDGEDDRSEGNTGRFITVPGSSEAQAQDYCLLSNPVGKEHPLLLNGNLTLAVWTVSGLSHCISEFHQRLSKSSQPLGGRVQKSPIVLDGPGGSLGVVQGMSIPFYRLSKT